MAALATRDRHNIAGEAPHRNVDQARYWTSQHSWSIITELIRLTRYKTPYLIHLIPESLTPSVPKYRGDIHLFCLQHKFTMVLVYDTKQLHPRCLSQRELCIRHKFARKRQTHVATQSRPSPRPVPSHLQLQLQVFPQAYILSPEQTTRNASLTK